MSRVLVIQTAWLGDAVLTTPLVAAVAARHDAVDVLSTPDAAPLFATLPEVVSVLAYDKHGAQRGIRHALRIASTLRARRYAAAYLPHRSVRSAVVAWLAGIPRRIGFANAPALARALYTERVPLPDGHESARLAALAGGAPTDLRVVLTPADRAAARRVLEAEGVHAPFIALAPGSARPTKRWPHFAGLAERLAAEGRSVVVLGAPEDADRVPAAPRIANFAGRLPIRTSAAVVAHAAVAVANDSAVMHIAQAVGTPVVAIFGPTAPSLGFAPRGPRDRVVEHAGLACRPCSTHGGARCPLGHHRCLRDLPVARVLAAVRETLSIGEEAVVCE